MKFTFIRTFPSFTWFVCWQCPLSSATLIANIDFYCQFWCGSVLVNVPEIACRWSTFGKLLHCFRLLLLSMNVPNINIRVINNATDFRCLYKKKCRLQSDIRLHLGHCIRKLIAQHTQIIFAEWKHIPNGI